MFARWLESVVPAPAAKGSDRMLKTIGVSFTRCTAVCSVTSCRVTITLALASTAASIRLGRVARSPWALELELVVPTLLEIRSWSPTLMASSLHSLPDPVGRPDHHDDRLGRRRRGRGLLLRLRPGAGQQRGHQGESKVPGRRGELAE